MKNEKLKIVYFGDARSSHMAFWSKGFAEIGHEVHIISPYKAEIEGVHVHPTKTKYNKYFNFFLTYLKMRKWIREINPDIIQAHFLGKYSFLAALINFHPFVGTVWGSDVGIFSERNFTTNSMFKYILRKSDTIQVFDQSTIDFLSHKYKIGNNKFFLQWWGTNPKKFRPLKKRKNIDILYLRRSMSTYSTEVFIQSINLVKREFPNLRTTMIKGKDFPDMKKLIDKFGLKKNIDVFEWIPQEKVSDLLNSSLIYADSFKRDVPGSSFGLTVTQAMACELPVILCDNPGVDEYIKNNYNGLTYKGGDYKDLAKCIIRLLKDRKLREKLGKNARKTVIKELNWNINIKKIEGKYLELVEKYKR